MEDKGKKKCDEDRLIRFVNDFNVLLENEIIKVREVVEGLEIEFDPEGENISCFLGVIQILVDEFDFKYHISEQDVYAYYQVLVHEGKFSKNHD